MTALATEAVGTFEQECREEIDRIDRDHPITDEQERLLKRELFLRAMILGWTGDPFKQPASAVLAAWRAVQARLKREASHAE